jgi:HrpA-like RNA helicase
MKSKAGELVQNGSKKKLKLTDHPATSFERIQETRRNLPIYSAKERLQAEIRDNASLVIIGETGSGKTTQIPQFVYEEAQASGIAITQPRRIAAIRCVARLSAG